MKLHLKSVTIGIVLGAGIVMALGAGISNPSNQVGRFQVTGTSDHSIMNDTATGQAWAVFLNENTNADPFWKPKTSAR